MRTPPGRVGRLWLLHRLDVARRGSEVLEQKRRALQRQLERIERDLGVARGAWERSAHEAERWWQLAAILGGERSLALARATPTRPARVRVDWRNALGVVYPAEVDLEPGPTDGPVGGSAALAQAAIAYSRALTDAARFAAVRLAHERLAAELAATNHRLRAIERRWIPRNERALAELELALDEAERTEIAQAIWSRDRLRDRA